MAMASVPAIDHVIDEICSLPWSSLSGDEMADVAWAYYFFSIQFRESLGEARRLFPEDASLMKVEAEECDTSNLSPWPGVAETGERMNHDEFMRRTLALMAFSPSRAARHEAIGRHYLANTRALRPETRAASLASYEDGGLERVLVSGGEKHERSFHLLAASRLCQGESRRFPVFWVSVRVRCKVRRSATTWAAPQKP